MFSAILLLFCLAAVQSEQVGSMKFMTSTNEVNFNGKIASEVAIEEVGPIVGHMAGCSNSYRIPEVDVLPSVHPINKPKANLIFFVEGASNDLFESQYGEYDILSGRVPEDNADMISRMLTGRPYNQGVRYHKGQRLLVHEPASIVDVMSETGKGESLVFTFASTPEVASSLQAHQELLNKNQQWKTFTYTLDMQGGLKSLNKNNKNAELLEFFGNILGNVNFEESAQKFTENGKPVFNTNDNNDRVFLLEVELINAFLNSLDTESAQFEKLMKDNSPDLFIFAFSGLESIAASHDADSVAYSTASSIMQSLIPQLSQKLSQLYNEKLVSQIITLRSDFARDTPKLRNKRAAINPAFPCFDTEADCTSNTGNCTDLGACEIVKRTDDKECWRCVCDKGYIGDSCEYQDIVAEFHLILWTSVFLIMALFLSTCLLAYSDDAKDTMLFRQQATSKDE